MRIAARLALVFAALVLAALPLAAADGPKVVGTWDAVSTTPNGDMPSVIKISDAGGVLKAEIEIDGYARTVSDEKLAGNVLTMKVTYEGGVYDVEVKIDGDTLDGTWQGGGYSGTLKGKRRP